jgi:hypothetical protein
MTGGKPRPTGEFETIEADSCVLALGQDVDLSFLAGVDGLTVTDGVVEVGPDMMTGCAGVFAGGDMVPAERTVTVAVGHGKKAAKSIDAYPRGIEYKPDPKHEVATFDNLNTWYYTDAPATVQPALDAARRAKTFDEVLGGLERVERALRGAAVHVLRQLLRVRQLLRRVPRQRGDQAGAGEPVQVQLRLLQGLRHVRDRVPVRRDPHGARDDLTGSPGHLVRRGGPREEARP